MDTIPWFGWSPATMKFFEENLPGPVAQPANAWTSLVYCAVALFLLVSYREDAGRRVRFLVPIAALVGVTSALYHASYAFFFQVFDLGSMYLLSSFLLSSNAERLFAARGRGSAGVSSSADRHGFSGKTVFAVTFAAVFLGSLAVLLTVRGKVGALLFGLEVIAVIGSEAYLARTVRPKPGSPEAGIASGGYRPWLIAVALLAAAFGIWILDINRLVFSADSHVMNGHGLWHIVNSFCFVFLYRFYRDTVVLTPGPDRTSAR